MTAPSAWTPRDELQRTLPQSSLIVLPGVGHIAFEEMPDVCNQAMRDWLINPSPSAGHHMEAPAFRRQPVEPSTPPEVRGAA